jgi:hypothetical protein
MEVVVTGFKQAKHKTGHRNEKCNLFKPKTFYESKYFKIT